ncbi:hypothetical protein PLAN_40604 [Planktothrix rubescens CCAP 1459/22]|uniref:Uncharacterized protein n=1 Tax=Planktothrix rubescens CCAP 1459/22 TaxID=329571 RepID=A0A6J7ZPG3_PLARU|nr:hypothetical protein PLAN_40604 [Planktothrix rubescens NIVA-CYA 18]
MNFNKNDQYFYLILHILGRLLKVKTLYNQAFKPFTNTLQIKEFLTSYL